MKPIVGACYVLYCIHFIHYYCISESLVQLWKLNGGDWKCGVDAHTSCSQDTGEKTEDNRQTLTDHLDIDRGNIFTVLQVCIQDLAQQPNVVLPRMVHSQHSPRPPAPNRKWPCSRQKHKTTWLQFTVIQNAGPTRSFSPFNGIAGQNWRRKCFGTEKGLDCNRSIASRILVWKFPSCLYHRTNLQPWPPT